MLPTKTRVEKKSAISIAEARIILAEKGQQLSDAKIDHLLHVLQFLCDSWLDTYERGKFAGRTVQELLIISDSEAILGSTYN